MKERLACPIASADHQTWPGGNLELLGQMATVWRRAVHIDADIVAGEDFLCLLGQLAALDDFLPAHRPVPNKDGQRLVLLLADLASNTVTWLPGGRVRHRL